MKYSKTEILHSPTYKRYLKNINKPLPQSISRPKTSKPRGIRASCIQPKPCGVCGQSFLPRRSINKFCSRECFSKSISLRQTGINNPSWKGGVSSDNYRYTSRFRKKFPQKFRAHNLVKQALEDGTLIRKPCEICGATERIHAHHDDYTKPLDVSWLCQKHHIQRHVELRRNKAS